jgi:phosphatidylglycerophosphate synthase
MIDGFFKKHIDPLWEYPARGLVRLGLTANQVTVLGLVLVAGSCAAYFWHRSSLALGLLLALSFAADSLDGAVARLRDQCSSFGGYLDAVVDRYQEVLVFLTLAAASGDWLPACLALVGSLLTSYAKARVAIERPVSNDGWPDLFERLERIIFVCALLVLDGVLGMLTTASLPVLSWGLWILAAATNATAVQRFLRARRLLIDD